MFIIIRRDAKKVKFLLFCFLLVQHVCTCTEHASCRHSQQRCTMSILTLARIHKEMKWNKIEARRKRERMKCSATKTEEIIKWRKEDVKKRRTSWRWRRKRIEWGIQHVWYACAQNQCDNRMTTMSNNNVTRDMMKRLKEKAIDSI